jgi:hypothetical protein
MARYHTVIRRGRNDHRSIGDPGYRTVDLRLVGGPPGTRTPNLRIKSPLLCQLS